MPQPHFTFKQFKILHDKCAMKVNTDGCLLGSWAMADAPKTILDIGAGSGLIGLMLAQRYPEARVDLVEIEPHCAEQCAQNASNSPFAKRVFVHNVAIQNFEPDSHYDLIASNPPYFENHLISPDAKRKLARHHTTLTLETLAAKASQLLSDKGTFCIILPENRKDEFVRLTQKSELHLAEQVALCSLPDKPVSRQLLAFTKAYAKPNYQEITIEQTAGTYSETVKKWFAPFYLNR